ncbi:site-specific integrase [Acidobacteriia bacterium AH_259_A11_L15]|nr:site-specific integrase [Acidobacteriia bacterium AH_259_A11_L15]
MEAKGYTGGYIASVLKPVKSWLAFNELQVRGGIKIRGMRETPTLQDERIPSQEELKRIFLSADEKTRMVCALLAHSGLRPEVLGNYEGTDGLRVKDLSEIEVKGNELVFKRIPTIVRVRPNLSKKAHEYFTFLGSEGCDYLKAYLEMRMRNGEEIHGNSPIITPKIAKKDFIRTINIGDAARKAIRKAGFQWRPYVLRSYFDTQMMLAESKGLVIRDYRSFFMGHKGDIEAVYTLNKRKLPPEVIEQMRDCYSKAQRYLQTVESGNGEEELTKAFKRQLLLVAGFKPDEIKEEQLELNEEEFHKLVRERLFREVRNNQAGQQVIAVNELETRLLEGWEFVGLLPNDKAIVKQPDVA